MIERRIDILGPSASGKTQIAEELSLQTGIEHYSTDRLLFETNPLGKMVRVTDDEFNSKVKEIIGKDSWILEGKFVSPEVIEIAELVIWVHDDLFTCLANQWTRYIKDPEQRMIYGLENNLSLTLNILRQHTGFYSREKLQSPRVYVYEKVEKLLKRHKEKVYKVYSSEDKKRLMRRFT